MTMKMSILSQRTAQGGQQKAGGKIRPGIKVLTRKAMEDKRAVAIYDRGVAAQTKFSDIEKQITEVTGMKNPMYPRNTPYFSVAASDFGMPELAAIIVEKYGEPRDNDPVKRLYRFPVVFHSDDLGEIYPNEFRRYGGEPGYESHYGDDGQRYCRYLPEVTRQMIEDQKMRRIKRAPRREKVIRGLCDPYTCPEYLQGQCKFRGKLQFYIPGIPTTVPLVMETTSEIAAEAIYADLERIHKVFGGIPRTNPNKPGKPIFYITKVRETRTYFDEDGKKKTGEQWVPKLQADIDLGTLLQDASIPQLSHTAPVAWLAAPKAMPDAAMLPPAAAMPETGNADGEVVVGEAGVDAAAQEHGEGEAQSMDIDGMLSNLSDLVASAGVEDEVAFSYFDLKLGASWDKNPETVTQAIGIMNAMAKRNVVGLASIMGISVLINSLGVSEEDFKKYARIKFGQGYSRDVKLLGAVLENLTELSASGKESALAFIKAEILNGQASAPAAA
ncbi:recombination directionality factor [Noviherbaspirillum pedocola]|uniref:Uncharacterized protein n=1 Tax=Noviherbaspirillum pedocola TaxID=2801341 RepID=A0A934SSZ8_9BURK|nr:hypothetical protein [Noviherbaspirillum pedocola]MBK4736035.1 hypothetical protein [Noviherbaspirillum pedocola]